MRGDAMNVLLSEAIDLCGFDRELANALSTE
jgi:hypothetical protein